MTLLGKLNWTNISSYLDRMKLSNEVKSKIQNIFQERATNSDKTISFSDLVDLLAEAKKEVAKKNEEDKPKTDSQKVPKASFQSEDEAYSALGKYILGEQFSGTLSNKQKEDLKIKINDDGSCTVTYNGEIFTAYKNKDDKIFFINKQSHKTLKQSIKEDGPTDAAKTYRNRGSAVNLKSKYNAETGTIENEGNKDAVSQVQTFASMLMNDNENSRLTLDGQIVDGKRVMLSGQEIIDTMDTENKDGKISIDELLKYLKAVETATQGIANSHQDKGSRRHASSVNLSTKDLINIGELFKKYDTDHDNLLDKNELDNLINDFRTRGNTASSLAKSVTDADEAEIISDLIVEDGDDDNKYSTKKGADGKFHYYTPDGSEISAAELKKISPAEYKRLQLEKSQKPENVPSEIQTIADLYKSKYNCDVEIEYNEETEKYELVRRNVTPDIEELRISLNENAWQNELSKSERKERADAIRNRYPRWRIDLKRRRTEALKRLENPEIEDHFESITTYFKDNRIIQTDYDKGHVSGRKNIGGVPSAKKLDGTKPEEEKFYEPLEIKVEYSGEAAKYKEKLAVFEQALKNNKAELMQDLNIDNDTYDMLARTAIAIAIQETLSTDNLRSIIRAAEDFTPDTAELITRSSRSLGMTSIKYNLFASDEKIGELFQKYNILENEDITKAQNSAIATIIILARHNRTLDTTAAQEGIANAQGAFVEFPEKEMTADGTTRKTEDGSTKGWSNEITRQDALVAIWNKGYGNSGIKTGSITSDNSYILNIRKYANGITISDKDPAKRTEALNRRKEEVKIAKETAEATRTFNDMDNSGQMGSLIFMPKMYKNPNEYLNTEEEINKIKGLTTIDNDLKEQLVTALKNGELAFGFGLTDDELNSLRNQDIILILKHLNNLRTKISDKVTTTDGINKKEAATIRTTYASVVAETENDFRKEYQQNHAEHYRDSGTNPTVLRETAQHSVHEESYINKAGQRRGFQHVKPLGVNVNTSAGRISAQNELLAKAAHKEASKSFNGGANCLTGVKAAMEAAGINVDDMSHYGSVPKHAKNWFDSHPNMFTQVKSIAIGDGKARDIVYSDLKSLPAGYIVIYVPGNGDEYANQAGHIVITNGNGQGYSDSTDNLEWGNYYSNYGGTGKGEHGKFFVYKLNEENWAIENGKLKYTGS